MNIFLHELKTYRKSTLIWAASISALIVVFLYMYTSFSKDMSSTSKLLEKIPAAYRAALNLSLKNFFDIFGFYAYLLTFVILAASVQAMNIGVGIISKEITGKTADFLLSKPVSRAKVMASKILAGLVILIFCNIIFTLVAYFFARVIDTAGFSAKIFLLLTFTVFLTQIMFLALGILLSVLIPKIKSVVSVSLPAVFTFYVIGIISTLFKNQDLRYITPFKYFNTDYIIANGRYETNFLVIGLLVIVVSLVVSFIIYLGKDVRAAS